MMTRETIQITETIKIRASAFDGEFVVWVMENDKWSQYGVYDRSRALETAAWLAERAA